MSAKALYPGTFDPPTNGHVDLIQRGAKLFEHLTVAILNNPVKNPLFTVEERVEMLQEVTSVIPNVSVATFDGMMVEFARMQGATAVLRGIRAISDYEHEFQMALMNRRLAPEIETVFLQPAGRYSFVSSRMVKEVFSFGGRRDGAGAAERAEKAARTDGEELVDSSQFLVHSSQSRVHSSEQGSRANSGEGWLNLAEKGYFLAEICCFLLIFG
jgi:pantetheine-phosphate adenylyltransferase